MTIGIFEDKRQDSPFNRVASDQTVDETINKHQKFHCGIMGYCTTTGTAQRGVLTSHIMAL